MAKREIDNIPGIHPRPVEMQVLCLGLSRTSTMTMYTALNKLGYRCYHFLELAHRNKENMKLRHVICWLEALRYKVLGIGEPYYPADFDKLLQGYSALSDMPCVNFSDEMLAAFPNAKVVLTSREPVAWVKSFDSSIYRVLEWLVWPFLRFIDPEGMGAVHETMRLAITDYTSPKPWTDREALAAHMSKHVEHIRSVVPPENLLEFHPSDGWEVLCRFLGKEVPKEPFPYINKGNFTANVFKLVLVLKTINICGPYFIALGVGYLAWTWYGRF